MITKTTLQYAVVLAAAACTGCASLSYDTYITVPAGKSTNPRPADEDEEVQVLVESLPEGVTVKDGELAADPERYEVLGRVGVIYNKPTISNFGFLPYDYMEGERWRDVLCTWQIPLAWMSLSAWAWISPTFLPCHVSQGDEQERRANMVKKMKLGTKRVGGNTLVVGGFGGYDFVTASTHPNGMTASSTGSVGAVGYALRAKRAAARP